MDEYKAMMQNPRLLFDFYLDLITNGKTLDDEQIVKFEYLKTLYVKAE